MDMNSEKMNIHTELLINYNMNYIMYNFSTVKIIM